MLSVPCRPFEVLEPRSQHRCAFGRRFSQSIAACFTKPHDFIAIEDSTRAHNCVALLACKSTSTCLRIFRFDDCHGDIPRVAFSYEGPSKGVALRHPPGMEHDQAQSLPERDELLLFHLVLELA
jgi:hypothetical protein